MGSPTSSAPRAVSPAFPQAVASCAHLVTLRSCGGGDGSHRPALAGSGTGRLTLLCSAVGSG